MAIDSECSTKLCQDIWNENIYNGRTKDLESFIWISSISAANQLLIPALNGKVSELNLLKETRILQHLGKNGHEENWSRLIPLILK